MKGFNLVAQSNRSKSSSSKRRMLDFIDAGVLPRDEEETRSETKLVLVLKRNIYKKVVGDTLQSQAEAGFVGT